MLADGIKETTTTVGTGNVTLVASPGFARFSQAFVEGPNISYTIRDGNNWEWGIGYLDSGMLVRETITSTFVSGVYSNSKPSRISLSGNAEVFCGLHLQSLIDFIKSNIPKQKKPLAQFFLRWN